MRNLTLFYIKKRLPQFLIVLSLTLIACLIYISTTDFVGEYMNYETYQRYKGIRDTGLTTLTIIMLILATAIPIYEFSFKMRKNGCDLFYSLPIKRNKLYLFKYLFGLCEVLSIFIIDYIIIIAKAIPDLSVVPEFHVGYMFGYFGIIILIGILYYSWVSFFYTRANTILDGIITLVLSGLVLMSVVFGILVFGMHFKWFNNISGDNIRWLEGYYYSPFISLFTVTGYFDMGAKGDARYITVIPDYITWAIAIASIPLFILLTGKERAEESEDITDSYFSYKVFIPTFIVSLFMICEIDNYSWIAVVIGGYIGYVIHNRSFLIRKNDLIVLLVSVAIGFGLMCVKLI